MGRRQEKVSCEQNTGPFSNDGVPTVSKEDIKKKLEEFYYKCLAPEYRDGHLEGGNTNSESQSYALWQAYWAGDRKTFRKVLDWTNDYLKRRDDSLFSWKFELEKRSPFIFWERPYFRNYRVKIIDQNSATDADIDIAYVLFKAGADWNRQDYIDQARETIRDIWEKETASLGGQRFVVGGNWANEENRLLVNPSYFSPQALRTFAVFDESRDWNGLISDSYNLLAAVSSHGENQPYVPPNWVQINKADSAIAAYLEKSDSRDFSYDAFRTFWRTGFDQLITPNLASWNYVSAAGSFERDWLRNQQMCALYIFRGGQYACDTSTTSTLAAPIGIFSVTNGYLASQVIEKYYVRDGKLQFPDTDFYAKSWHWFGAYLWANS